MPLPTTVLQLFLFSLLLTVVRSEKRLPKKNLQQKRHLPRTAKYEDIEQVRILDFSEDSDHQPDAEGEYTHATLLRDPKDSFPSSYTICTSFMVKAWTTEFTAANIFYLNDKDGDGWGTVSVYPADTFTEYRFWFGNVDILTTSDKLLYTLQWTHLCASLDAVTGMVALVVDGQVLHAKVEEEGGWGRGLLAQPLGSQSDMKHSFDHG